MGYFIISNSSTMCGNSMFWIFITQTQAGEGSVNKFNSRFVMFLRCVWTEFFGGWLSRFIFIVVSIKLRRGDAEKETREKRWKKVPSHPKNYILLILTLTFSEDVVMQREGSRECGLLSFVELSRPLLEQRYLRRWNFITRRKATFSRLRDVWA